MLLHWAGNKRKLRVTAMPNVTLRVEHVPPHCRRARTVLLGPLTPNDLDAASFIRHRQGQPLSSSPPITIWCNVQKRRMRRFRTKCFMVLAGRYHAWGASLQKHQVSFCLFKVSSS